MPSLSPVPEWVYRAALGALIVGAVAIGLPFRLRADRAGGRVSPRTDPAWFWIGMAIIGPPLALACLAFVIKPGWFTWGATEWPPGVRLLGIPLGAGGLALFAWMFRHLGVNVTSTATPRRNASLVTTGPYRWMRHPMYTAALGLAVAAALLTANRMVGGGGLLMFLLLALRSRTEEARLVEKFGAAYRAYQQRTGRFFPRWGSRD